jgi:hypothetical protein
MAGYGILWRCPSNFNEILGVTSLKISEIKSIKDNSKLATFQTKEQKQSFNWENGLNNKNDPIQYNPKKRPQ